MDPALATPDGQEDPSARGRPQRSTLLRVCPYILGNEFCERIAYYGLAINLVNYLVKVMGLSDSDAAMQVMLFQGTAYITPLLGAYLADARWGRYKTILVFSAVYCLGMACMAIQAAIPSLRPEDPRAQGSSDSQLAVLYTALYIIALGTGGIKPNVAAFGADQFDDTNPTDVANKKSFFMWFYFTVNCGSLLGTTVVVYVQENVSWSIGYAIPAVCLSVAICSFLIGSPLYKHVKPHGSPFVRVYQVLVTAHRNRRAEHFDEAATNWEEGLAAPLLTPFPRSSQKMAQVESLMWLDKATLRTGSSRHFSTKQVEEVKLVLRMLPVFFTTVLYATVYAQFSSFFILQGDRMDRTIPGGHKIPSASLTLFDTLAIIILVPAYEHLLLPFLARLKRPPTMLQRIGWGMVMAVFAMGAAAFVEFVRKKRLYMDSGMLGVYWQIPQYTLIGASEVLCMVGQLEFFYDQAPDVMRSMGMAMQMLSISLGSYLSGALTVLVQKLTSAPDREGGWLPKDLDHGHLEYFFLLLGLLMSLDLLVFIWIASNYVYKAVPHKRYRIEGYQPSATPSASAQLGEGTSGDVSRLHSTAMPISGRPFLRDDEPGDPEPSAAASDLYARSITVVPQSMVLPGPMR